MTIFTLIFTFLFGGFDMSLRQHPDASDHSGGGARAGDQGFDYTHN